MSAKGEVLWGGSPSGRPGTVYAGTGEGLYVSEDAGVTWKRVDAPPEVKDVSMGAFDGKNIHFIAGGGLYIGKDDTWKRFSGLSGLEGVCAIDEGEEESAVLAWSRKKLYIVSEDGAQELGSASLWPAIDDAASRDGRVYVVSGSDVFMFKNDKSGWEKIELYPGNVREETPDPAMDAAEPEEAPSEYIDEGSSSVRSRINVSGQNGLIIATANGIYGLNPDGKVTDLYDTAGLPAGELRFAADTPKGLLAATGEKVFIYSKENNTWAPVFEPAGEGKINYIFSAVADPGEDRLWVAAGASLYRGPVESLLSEIPDVEHRRVKHSFDGAPSVREVQKMAIEYAEVNPKKIEAWRSAAKWKAVMPKLSVDFGQDRDDNIELYTSATNSYSYIGPEEKSDGWDVGLQWDLSDLVWNESQTSIDVRSKLMVQLRNEILQEVTRLYFERKRILAETGKVGTGKGKGKGKGKGGREQGLPLRSPTGDNIGKGEAGSMEEREIRVEELTAHIDAFTGGRFSEKIAKNIGSQQSTVNGPR